MVSDKQRQGGVIILGSARSDGNTREMVNLLSSETGMPVIDLNDYNVGYFEYDNYDRGDDFLPLIDNVLQYDTLVFATPVYWYNMSAIMKNFFDRFTDLLKHHKELGRKFRGRSMAVLSCSATEGDDPDFGRPFERTADYLGMRYLGHLATWSYGPPISPEVALRIVRFASNAGLNGEVHEKTS